jgi:hypothetical protein
MLAILKVLLPHRSASIGTAAGNDFACISATLNATSNILSLLRRGGNHRSSDRNTELVEAE